MKHIKPGRGPSMMGVVAGIAAAVFGVLWIIGAASMTSEVDAVFYNDPFARTMDAIFPLFGLVFVAIAVVGVIYNLRNATGENRYSEYDIVDDSEEPDPLNERFGPKRDAESSFCPYCGCEAGEDFVYCKKCGRKLPGRG